MYVHSDARIGVQVFSFIGFNIIYSRQGLSTNNQLVVLASGLFNMPAHMPNTINADASRMTSHAWLFMLVLGF